MSKEFSKMKSAVKGYIDQTNREEIKIRDLELLNLIKDSEIELVGLCNIKSLPSNKSFILSIVSPRDRYSKMQIEVLKEICNNDEKISCFLINADDTKNHNLMNKMNANDGTPINILYNEKTGKTNVTKGLYSKPSLKAYLH